MPELWERCGYPNRATYVRDTEFRVSDLLASIHAGTWTPASWDEPNIAMWHAQSGEAIAALQEAELIQRDGAWYRLVRVDAPKEDREHA